MWSVLPHCPAYLRPGERYSGWEKSVRSYGGVLCVGSVMIFICRWRGVWHTTTGSSQQYAGTAGEGGSGMRSLPPEHWVQKATMLCNSHLLCQLTAIEQGTLWDYSQYTYGGHRIGSLRNEYVQPVMLRIVMASVGICSSTRPRVIVPLQLEGKRYRGLHERHDCRRGDPMSAERNRHAWSGHIVLHGGLVATPIGTN